MIRSWTVRTVVLGLAVVGLGVAWLGSGTAASAGDTAGVGAVTTIAATVMGGDEVEVEYVGSKKCKMCHKKEFDSWAETTHATSFDILKPGERAEAKAKHELDAAKDYTGDKSCLDCHVVGFGKMGGYNLVNWDKTAEKLVKKAGHVGCESCHGPGSGYVKLHKEIKKEKRTYTRSEMEEAGLAKITEETCTVCHNDKSPTYDESKKFDFEAMKEKGTHELQELKQREE